VEANQNVERSLATGATFSGGDGGSVQAAGVIENASSEAAGVVAENDWIKLHRPGSRKILQALVSHGERLFDEIELVNARWRKLKALLRCNGILWKVLREVPANTTGLVGKWRIGHDILAT
jgi:hypothetical protein